MGLGVVDLLIPAFDVPLPPGGDDLHLGREGLDRQLEPHLVVALAGAAVADGIGTLGQRDLDDPFRDDRPGKGGAEQVLVLIHRARLDGGEYVVLDEDLPQILDVELGGAGLLGLFLQTGKFLALADVGGDRDDLAVVVVFLQPRNNDGGVEAAGIGQHHFFNLVAHCPNTLSLYPDRRVAMSVFHYGLIIRTPLPFCKRIHRIFIRIEKILLS